LLALGVSAAGALAVALGTGATDLEDLSIKSWLIAGIAVLGSGGMVAFTENGPAAPAIKAIVSFLTVGLGALVVALDDNVISQAEWLTAFSAAALATGLVFQATDDDSPPEVPPR
jgi:hypothetical protein